MEPSRRLLIGAVVLVGGVAGFAAGRTLFRPIERIVQPIAFNHQKHVGDLEIDCETCHEQVLTGEHAGLPSLTTCLGCHEEPQTESAEEQKIRELAAAGEDDVFKKLFRVPDHTFYTHRRHAGIAALPCERCHGAVAASQTPPERPLVRISMDFCVECHERDGAALDCTRCHR